MGDGTSSAQRHVTRDELEEAVSNLSRRVAVGRPVFKHRDLVHPLRVGDLDRHSGVQEPEVWAASEYGVHNRLRQGTGL